MNTLKITAITLDGKLYKSKYTIDKLPAGSAGSSHWYLHGKLEDIIGFDKAIATNAGELGCLKEMHDEAYGGSVLYQMDLDAIVDVKVEGVDEDCVGFFWTGWKRTITINGEEFPNWAQLGLVCLKSDKKAIADAMKKYKSKRATI